MADAGEMLTGISSLFFVIVFAGVIVIFTARAHYATFARYIKLATLVNGLVAPPLLVLVMLAANNRNIMGDQTNGLMLNLLGWTTVAVMSAAGLAFALRGGA